MQIKSPPQNELELLKRAAFIAGRTLAELSMDYFQPLPKNLRKDKGFVGQLIEWHLGASSGNKPETDFPNLGIELKTLPYTSQGKPKESTYICTAPLSLEAGLETWETSRLRKKLIKVLWVPVEACPSIPLSERRVGIPKLLDLDIGSEKIIKEDWEDLMDMLHLGNISHISAHQGQYLQIRPKAAHSRILVSSFNLEGEEEWVVPKGFYLRPCFTQQILSF